MAIRRGDLVQLGWRHRHLNGVGASGVRIRMFVQRPRAKFSLLVSSTISLTAGALGMGPFPTFEFLAVYLGSAFGRISEVHALF